MTNDSQVDRKRQEWLESFMAEHGMTNQQVADLFFGTHHAISQYRRGVRRTSKRLIACAMIWEENPALWEKIRDTVQREYKRT